MSRQGQFKPPLSSLIYLDPKGNDLQRLRKEIEELSSEKEALEQALYSARTEAQARLEQVEVLRNLLAQRHMERPRTAHLEKKRWPGPLILGLIFLGVALLGFFIYS